VHTRGRDVTRGDGVDSLAGGSWRAVRFARVGRRGVERVSRCAVFEMCSCFTQCVQRRAENTRALDRSKGRERPSLTVSGGRANTRTLYRNKDRECPSLTVSRGRAKNTRALYRDKGRKRPSLTVSGDRFEGREHLCYSFVGTDLVLIVSRQVILYSRPDFGVVAVPRA